MPKRKTTPSNKPAPPPATALASPPTPTQPGALKTFYSAVPATEIDLLREQLSDLKSSDEKIFRGLLLELVLKGIFNMETFRLQETAQFIAILENQRGSITPAEEFIINMVRDHFRLGLTPDIVARELDPNNTDGFKVSFYEAIEGLKRTKEMYPELFSKTTPDPIV